MDDTANDPPSPRPAKPPGPGTGAGHAGRLARLESLLAGAPLGICLFDTGLRCVQVNPVLAGIDGQPVTAHLGRRPAEVLAGMPLAGRVESLLGQVLRTGALASAGFTSQDLRRAGEAGAGEGRSWEASCYPVAGPGGALAGVGMVVRETTEQLRTEQALRDAVGGLELAEQRSRAVLDTAVDGIITIDGAGLVQSFNPAAEQLFGYQADELLGRNVKLLMPEPYHSQHDQYLARYQATGQPRIIGVGREVEGRRRDGSTFPLYVAVSEIALPDARLYTGIVRDLSERKQYEAELAHGALHDPLTGLPNRALLLDRLDQALAALRRDPSPLVVLFLDLDRFKLINDSYGHHVGDELLQVVAARLRQTVRPTDTVARLGGDEFVVVCEGVAGTGRVAEIAQRLLDAVAVPTPLDGFEVFTATSIGIAITADPDCTASRLLQEADAAMYRAKQAGRGTFAVHDQAAQGQALEYLQLEHALHHALARGELRLHYQPELDLTSGRVIGMEALLRWQHPDRGLLGPSAFLKQAEDSGLIAPIGTWVLNQACRDAAGWASRHPGGSTAVWVNLAARQLAHPELPRTVQAAVDQAGLDPHLLYLEITEGVLMQDAPATERTLSALKDIGVRLAVDDFGTGYSSLAYLQRFPVDAVKVDRSFIAGLPDDTGSGNIVRAVVALADSLGLASVAEGVESAAQLSTVRQLGCHVAQGFLIGYPAPSDAVEGLLGLDPWGG